MTCKHNTKHSAECVVNYLEDTGRFMLNVQLTCGNCSKPFVFIGLPPGLNMRGATVSVDGRVAALAIAPEGTEPTAIDLISYAIHGGRPQ